jgi:hypothetical protein
MVPEHENSIAMTEDSITISPGGRVPIETTTPDAGTVVERLLHQAQESESGLLVSR